MPGIACRSRASRWAATLTVVSVVIGWTSAGRPPSAVAVASPGLPHRVVGAVHGRLRRVASSARRLRLADRDAVGCRPWAAAMLPRGRRVRCARRLAARGAVAGASRAAPAAVAAVAGGRRRLPVPAPAGFGDGDAIRARQPPRRPPTTAAARAALGPAAVAFAAAAIGRADRRADQASGCRSRSRP